MSMVIPVDAVDESELVERTVLFDVYGWTTPIPGRLDGRRDAHVARQGQTIKVSEAEAARGEALGALGTEAQARATISAGAEPPSWSDEQLDSASVTDITAYLGQHPSEAERVADREGSRADRKMKVRKGVMDATARVLEEREAALADAADAAEVQAQAEADAAAARAGGAPTAGSSAAGAPSIPG